MRRLLDGGFRPRTACDLTVVDTASVDAVLPSLEQLTEQLTGLVGACRDLLGSGEPLVVIWDGGKAKPKKSAT